MRASILGTTVAIVVLAVALYSSAALADATLVKVEPPQDAVLTEAPGQVDMWFSQPLARNAEATSITLRREGSATEIHPLYEAVDPSDSSHLIFSPPPNLTAGRYTVSWKATSAEDGRISQGEYAFTIDPEASPSPAASEGSGTDVLAMALITLAGVGGGAALGLLAFVFRRAIGWGWHRPPSGGLGGEHH